MGTLEIGKIRQSAIVMNYGPGAIIDFRHPVTGAAISVVAASLEEWLKQAEEVGINISDMQTLKEPRLGRKLGVTYFRLPPVAYDHNDDEEDDNVYQVGQRFPKWLQCPKCNLIQPVRGWKRDPGDPSRYCSSCSRGLAGQLKAYAVPVRFILSCKNGHLDDFPWYEWVHSGSNPNRTCTNKTKYYLKTKGPGLAGMEVSCPKCNSRNNMEYIFRRAAHEGRKCGGKRPWLPIDSDEECTLPPVTLQRGASNLYFPQVVSAIIIPPWSEAIIKNLGHRWHDLESITTKEMRHQQIDIWEENDEYIKKLIQEMGKETFIDLIDSKIERSQNLDGDNLRWDEYQQFNISEARQHRVGDDFDIRRETLPDNKLCLSSLFRVVSLREVRVLTGFSRIEPPPGKPPIPVRIQYLSKFPMNWLPAIEVRGEGIYFTLDKMKLNDWASQESVLNRVGLIDDFSSSKVLNPDNNPDIEISHETKAKFLLMHSLAHILMKQLSLQCGYSSASLRERLYVGDAPTEMSGVLIYTATSDSDGTLGGLQREGMSKSFLPMFIESIKSHVWCSSDPLCIKGLVSATESSNLAACHSCLLAPETSCEDFNRYLDRATLVGTPEDREIGFFKEVVEQD
jgi:hypothetical protein